MNNQPDPTQYHRYSDRTKQLIGQAHDALTEIHRSNPKEWELLNKQILLWAGAYCLDVDEAIKTLRFACDVVNTDNLMGETDD